jgi:hypothetical protein
MTTSFSALEDVLQQWASDHSGVPCVWRHQDAPQPERPFIDMHLNQALNLAGDDIELPPNSHNERYMIGDRDVLLSMRYFDIRGGDATGKLSNFLQTMQQMNHRSDLRKGDVIVVRAGNVIDRTYLEEDHNVERADTEIMLRTTILTKFGDDESDETSWIEEVNGSEIFKPDLITIPFSISK